MDPTTDETSWGFVPIIVDSSVNLQKIKIVFETSKIPAFIVNLITDAIQPFLPNLVNGAIKKQIGPKIQEIATQTALQFPFAMPKTDSNYLLSAKATQPPKILYNNEVPYLNVEVNLEIVNVKSGEKCPDFDEGVIPDRIYQGYDDIEIMMGDNLLDQLLWTLINSGIINVTVNDKQLQKFSLPISLTTTGMKILVPQFQLKYGANKGMYLRISKGMNPVPQLFIRSGRLLGYLELTIEMIVDTDSSKYPQELEECTTCVSAHVCNGKLGLMASLFSYQQLEDNYIAANVMQVKIQELTYVSGEIVEIDDALKQTLNALISALVPSLNAQARQGIKNPLIGVQGIQDFNILLGDTFLFASLEFKPAEETISSE